MLLSEQSKLNYEYIFIQNRINSLIKYILIVLREFNNKQNSRVIKHHGKIQI